ncbi:hypothetical protein GTY41_03560 [Streptomyces sp. SID685]|uniref:hypothetical protein n=1 Tax=Streptomyces sp. SID685 TaxID=2690322 RepID=UPI00136F5DB0|nr:hypothetical protein [Streptomyces sp. SID685]MYR84042.1 hypothetical protein [Streptomyces sp. SID685]
MTDQPFDLDGVLNDLAQKLVHDSRDWAVYRFDAWLYGIFVGWDCEKAHEHDETCDNGDAMQDVAGRHNWGPDTVARLRRARSSVRNASAMAAEIHRLRAELAAEQAQHAYTLRQRNNRSERLLHLRDLALTGDTEALLAAAKDTLAASVNDHKEQS